MKMYIFIWQVIFLHKKYLSEKTPKSLDHESEMFPFKCFHFQIGFDDVSIGVRDIIEGIVLDNQVKGIIMVYIVLRLLNKMKR